MACRPFRPHPMAVGGHRQTLLGFLVRRGLGWEPPTEDLVVDGEDGVRLLVRASWQPRTAGDRSAVVIVHGLGGDDGSSYVVATGALAWERGYHVLRMNMRGAGASAELCPRLYNAGLDQDLLAVLEAAGRRVERLFVVGFSLGASQLLLCLGRLAERVPVALRSAVAISPPLDLAACTDTLERPSNWAYQRYFMLKLRRDYRSIQRKSGGRYAPALEKGPRTVREYDDTITAPYGGWKSSADYYARSSAGPHLRRIDRPTLVLAAEDDPMIPIASVTRWPLPADGTVRLESLRTGGHVGFVAGTAAPGRFWAAERALAFVEETGAR